MEARIGLALSKVDGYVWCMGLVMVNWARGQFGKGWVKFLGQGSFSFGLVGIELKSFGFSSKFLMELYGSSVGLISGGSTVGRAFNSTCNTHSLRRGGVSYAPLAR